MNIEANVYLFTSVKPKPIVTGSKAKIKLKESYADCVIHLLEGEKIDRGHWGRVDIKSDSVPFEFYSTVSPGKDFLLIVDDKTIATGDVIRVSDF